MDYIGVSDKVLNEMKAIERKYLAHSKMLNSQSITPFEEQAPLPRMTRLLTGFEMKGAGAEGVYKKVSNKGGCCGGAIKSSMLGQSFQGGARRKLKGSGLLKGTASEYMQLDDDYLIIKDTEAHILFDTFLTEDIEIPATTSDLYIYKDPSHRPLIPFKRMKSYLNKSQFTESLEIYRNKINKFKYPYGLKIHLIEFSHKVPKNMSMDDAEGLVMYSIKEVGIFTEDEFKDYLFEGSDEAYGAGLSGGMKKRVKKVSKKQSKKESPKMGAGLSGGRKKVKKASKKEGAGLSGGKKPKTEWMILVEKTRKAHPDKSLKDVLKFIKENGLYKK